MNWYGIRHSSGELLSYNMAVIIHNNPTEVEWLIGPIETTLLKGGTPEEVAHHLSRSVIRLQDHPDLASTKWPLDKRDFW